LDQVYRYPWKHWQFECRQRDSRCIAANTKTDAGAYPGADTKTHAGTDAETYSRANAEAYAGSNTRADVETDSGANSGTYSRANDGTNSGAHASTKQYARRQPIFRCRPLHRSRVVRTGERFGRAGSGESEGVYRHGG
jgi:hypothetical protein